MKILCHHIYEYKKGLRSLVLHTLSTDLLREAEHRLKRNNIAYIFHSVSDSKLNVFFGDPNCVAVVARFGEKPLNELTPEEDFILGVMLGYSRIEQCRRYLKRSGLNVSEAVETGILENTLEMSVSA